MTHRTDEQHQRRRDLADAAAGRSPARLLPWRAEDGKPCLLLSADPSGHLSRLADEMEAVQLAVGAEVLELTRTVLGNPDAPTSELRYLGVRLSECLTDALRVAESRGARLHGGDA
ncbi:hypothetical protein I5Q34_18845 [Streptomyces sp. AV19]|uniref:hypothetical protein n=1 Tax=Streptomyces sp. AV19 TaxID=2793068 RepID=UPI0018FEFF17|nr:hypothetical protein [Streptomyces sp. AV19]MBH1936308.1 hypothetical protein [Streptomyces sp. AV19]MDG4532345.1 hypothetical protein [Streptomyces sp. AV19]